MALQWEIIDQTPTCIVKRVIIHGGWLVMSEHVTYKQVQDIHFGGTKSEKSGQVAPSLTFVPDPFYEWKV